MIRYSFLLPTRERPDLVARFFDSIVETTERLDDLEIVLCADQDDRASQQIADDRLNLKKVVVPPGLTMGRLNNACYRASTGRFVMGVNDDLILRTPGWDTTIRDVLGETPDDVALIHVNDLLYKHQLCCFPMLSRRACEAIGFCPDDYRRYRIDDHIYDTYNLLAFLGYKRIVYLPDVIFEHDNFLDQHQDPDQQEGPTWTNPDGRTYAPNSEALEHDGAIFERTLNDRKRDAVALSRLIHAARWDRAIFERMHRHATDLERVTSSLTYRRPDFLITRRTADGARAKTQQDRPRPSVTVAVVTADFRRKYASQCISLVKEHTRDFDLVILDNNGGTDFNHPREMNKILGMVKTDYLVLMDDDVYVGPGWLDGLLAAADEETGAVTPMHLDGDGKVSYAGAYLMGDGLGTHLCHYDTPDRPRETQCACSACLLIDLRKCGHLRFNTNERKYFLDLDHALQVWEAGFKVLCTPEVVVTHLGGATLNYDTTESTALYNRDVTVFIQDWVNTGRLGALEDGIWSRFPFLTGLIELPKRINALFDELPAMKPEVFAERAAALLAECRDLAMFRSLVASRIQKPLAEAHKAGDDVRVRVFRRIAAAVADAPALAEGLQPILVGRLDNYNIVHHRDKLYGLPLWLGPCNVTRQEDVDRPGVLIARTRTELERMIRQQPDPPAMQVTKAKARKIFLGVAKRVTPRPLRAWLNKVLRRNQGPAI